MWRLALKIIILLNADLVIAHYMLNSSKVTWKDAQNFCNVPSVGDIMYTEKDFNELPENITAWTSSRVLSSDWTSFFGCLDVAVNMVTTTDIKHTLNQYFPDSAHAVEIKSVFRCAYFCTTTTTAGIFFTFFKQVCKCFYEYELKSTLVKIPVCIFWDPAKMKSVDEVYSIWRSSLPIFKFEKDLRTTIIQNGDGEPDQHRCLAKTNGTFTTNDCNSKKMFTCEGGFYGFGTWTTAIYNCTVNGSLLTTESDLSNQWLRYFKYEKEKANGQCVAIIRTNNSRSLTYEYRSCSESLPVLCVDQSYSRHVSTPVSRNRSIRFSLYSTESHFDRTTNPVFTNSSDIQTPDYLCIKITAGGAITFTTIIIFLLGIIYIQRRKLTKAAFTSLTIRRDQNNYNEIPNQMAESITGQYYEVSPLSEIPASGGKPTAEQNINQIQHIDTSGYLIPSGMLETDGDYQTIVD